MTATDPRPATPTSDPPAGRATSRRDVLRTAGLVTLGGGAVLTLAACGADGQAGTPVSTSAAPSATSASPSSTPSASEAASSSAPKSAASTKAAVPSGPSVVTADVPVGGGVILDSADYVVTQPTKGTYKAFSKICTHQGCKVSEIASSEIICKCHGSAFSIKDGSVLKPPASKPLAESDVTVVGSKVYVTGSLPALASAREEDMAVEATPDHEGHGPPKPHWRGSPQLFAHLLRVVADQTGPGPLRATFSAAGDDEVFGSAQAFLQDVSPEMLRHFERVVISGEGPRVQVRLELAWTRKWWQPGMTPDSTIELVVAGTDAAAQSAAREAVSTALARGARATVAPGVATGIGTAAGMLLGIGVLVYLAVLFRMSDTIAVVAVGAGMLVGLAGGAFGGTWLIPALEVAPRDQTNLRRAVRAVGALVAALAVAGLSKVLFDRASG